jgi:hypothetical protein
MISMPHGGRDAVKPLARISVYTVAERKHAKENKEKNKKTGRLKP